MQKARLLIIYLPSGNLQVRKIFVSGDDVFSWIQIFQQIPDADDQQTDCDKKENQ